MLNECSLFYLAMRLLHLVQPLAPRDSWLLPESRHLALAASQVSGEASLHALRAVVADQGLPAEHIILSLGPSRAREVVRSAGIEGTLHAVPPFARASYAGPLLRRTLRRAGELDAILAWGPAAAQPTAKIAPHYRARTLTLDTRTGTLSRTFGTSQGISLPPQLSATPARAFARDVARRSLQLGNDELAVVALGDAAMPPDAVSLTLAAQSHAVTGRMMTLIIPACSAQLERALRHVHEYAFLYRVIVHDGPLAPVLAACDAAVFAPATTPHPPEFPAAIWAQLWHVHAKGPIVAPADLLPSRIAHTAARSARPTDLAGALLAALTAPAPTPTAHATEPFTPGVALQRAIQHLLSLPVAHAT